MKPLIRTAIEDMADDEFLDWYNQLSQDSYGTGRDWFQVMQHYQQICTPAVSDDVFPEWDAAAELADDARRGK